ncbi:MAG: GNAT family N-acetyltransferase [Rickettsiaceae bacterium]
MNVQPFFSPFQEIDLGDIILREIRVEDAQAYLDYMNNEKMAGFLTKENRPQTFDAAVEEVSYWGGLFPSKRSIYWAIALKEDDRMIGTAGFNMISFPNSRAEISYDLDPDYWGKGVMLRSIKAILKFADYVLGIVRIQATVITTNDRSIKVLERCGFVQEGYLKKYEVVEGELKDYYMYARVNI